MQLRAAATRIVGARHRETLVPRRRHERGLPAARMADHRDMLRVQRRLCLNPVENAARRPAPCGKRPPLVVGSVLRRHVLERREDAERVAVLAVGCHFVERERYRRIAARDNLLGRPKAALHAARRVDYLVRRAIADEDERRSRLLLPRDERRERERVRAERAAVFDAYALADCRAAHHHGVRLDRRKREVRRTLDGATAVDLAFEKLLYGGPAHIAPFLDGPRLAFGEQRRHVLRLRHLDGDCRVRD